MFIYLCVARALQKRQNESLLCVETYLYIYILESYFCDFSYVGSIKMCKKVFVRSVMRTGAIAIGLLLL